jgi:hypothetical protein
MPLPIIQYVIYPSVSLSIGRGSGVLMNVSVRARRARNNWILRSGKVNFSNTIIIAILM